MKLVASSHKQSHDKRRSKSLRTVSTLTVRSLCVTVSSSSCEVHMVEMSGLASLDSSCCASAEVRSALEAWLRVRASRIRILKARWQSQGLAIGAVATLYDDRFARSKSPTARTIPRQNADFLGDVGQDPELRDGVYCRAHHTQ